MVGLPGRGKVVIFDATNTTEERRRKLVQHFHGRYQYLFIESICNDTHTLEQNYLFKMRFSPDYQGVNEAEGLADFKARVAKYEEVYEPLVDRNVHYIKLIDMVTGRGYMDVNRISGYIPGKIVFFLMQICKAGMAQSRKIWLTRHGESVFNQRDLIGGDSSLSERGEDYARTLPDAVIDRLPLTLEDNTAPVSVWTSTLKRTIQTASYLPFAKLRWKALDEIHAGSCDGLTYAEIEEWFPEEFKARGDDKLRYRYPAGESYMDVIQRLEPVVIEMERERECVCVVSHQAVLRAILGYFTNTPLEDIPNLEIPLHTIIELRPRPDGTMEVERLPVGMPSQSSREGGNDAASAPYTTHMPPPASPVQIPLGAIGEDEREHLSSLQSFARRRQSYGDAKNGGTGTSLPEATQALGASRMQAAPVLRKRSASIGNNRELAGMPTPQLAGHDTAAAGAAAAAAAPARSVVALVGLAFAADGTDVCSFPYCDCWTDFPSKCLTVTTPTDANNVYSFTVSSSCDAPLGHGCSQELFKLELNSYAYCRWSKVTATYTWQGVTQPVPFAPVFDNAQASTPCTNLQMLKVTGINIPYAYIRQAPLTLSLTLDDTPGQRRCTSWPQLLNTTGTSAPYPIAFFSADNNCCALPTTPPPPAECGDAPLAPCPPACPLDSPLDACPLDFSACPLNSTAVCQGTVNPTATPQSVTQTATDCPEMVNCTGAKLWCTQTLNSAISWDMDFACVQTNGDNTYYCYTETRNCTGAEVTSSSTVSAPTLILGDLGVSPGTSVTGFPPGLMNGFSIHSADGASAAAVFDLTAAYNDAAGRVLCPISRIGNLGGLTLTPGLYKSTSGMEVTGSDLTLDAQGDSEAIFIFQMASTFEMTTGMKIVLINGAQARNIFWQVGTSGHLMGATVFQGTMMADQSITSGTGAVVHGRLLARIAAVTMMSAVFSLPA
ncbi:hypothetical protein FOA52_002672 [Chlamydomonas sp. UWO 241]|nr:hypothetical protein FOA52_002672 [Chlamydomonas sp. UWO 241]